MNNFHMHVTVISRIKNTSGNHVDNSVNDNRNKDDIHDTIDHDK